MPIRLRVAVNRLATNAVACVALLATTLTVTGSAAHASGTSAGASKHTRASCAPSHLVVRAEPVAVPGLSTEQVDNAVAIINAAASLHVPQRGQTIAVMTALESSALKTSTTPSSPQAGASSAPGATGLFGSAVAAVGTVAANPVDAALGFYRALTGVKNWENLTPTLAAHAAQRNLDPNAYATYWPRAVALVDKLTSGTGIAGLRNLAARAEQVARCNAATLRGRFDSNSSLAYVGQFAPAALDARALDFAEKSGAGWFDRCQSFVAQLAGRPFSGYRTALDAWQTFEAEGVAHPVTSNDGVAPPVGAWLYYQDSTNPAGHVVTYLGGGKIASTDVFGHGRVGIGPASAITDSPWHMQYLGWAAPWGQG